MRAADVRDRDSSDTGCMPVETDRGSPISGNDGETSPSPPHFVTAEWDAGLLRWFACLVGVGMPFMLPGMLNVCGMAADSIAWALDQDDEQRQWLHLGPLGDMVGWTILPTLVAAVLAVEGAVCLRLSRLPAAGSAGHWLHCGGVLSNLAAVVWAGAGVVAIVLWTVNTRSVAAAAMAGVLIALSVTACAWSVQAVGVAVLGRRAREVETRTNGRLAKRMLTAAIVLLVWACLVFRPEERVSTVWSDPPCISFVFDFQETTCATLLGAFALYAGRISMAQGVWVMRRSLFRSDRFSSSIGYRVG